MQGERKDQDGMASTGRGKRVVVIGGGITGLTAAYRLMPFLTHHHPALTASSSLGRLLSQECPTEL